MTFDVRDPDYAARVMASFARQEFMTLLGAEVVHVAPGEVDIALAVRGALCQQHGFVHGGACWSIADTAAGYAAQTVMAPDEGVLSIEVKVNFLAPAKGERLIARGRIERAGRTLVVGRADVFAEDGGRECRVAMALGTFMVMSGLADRT